MAETYSQIWALTMQEIARLELHLKLTVGAYFAGCAGTLDPKQQVLVIRHQNKPIHDLMIEIVRDQISTTHFFRLASIKRQEGNQFLIWRSLYQLAMRDGQA